MTALVWIPVLLPCIAAAVSLLHRRDAWTRAGDALSATVVLACGIALMVEVRQDGPLTTAGGMLRADALSAFMVTTIGVVAVLALWGGAANRRDPKDGAGRGGRYTGMIGLFLAAMSLAVVSDNLGLLWVAVEATTITTAFLVGHHRRRTALEAAWKYVVLSSVGVAIAFLGLILLYAASNDAGTPTLSWTALVTPLPLNSGVATIAVALATLGFATKVGLAPMHSWLPDAYSQAPIRVSGLLSGVSGAVAFYAILRVQAISNAVLGPGFMRALLVTAGLLSMAVAAACIVGQRDYKRMLAYSSIEHMGLLALGAAAGGPIAQAAVLLHILGHGIVKASMFLTAGRILTAVGSSRIADVRNLLDKRPDLAAPFLVGTAALLGFPPFVLFFTEVAIMVACWQRGLGWAAGVALALMLVVFAGFGRHVLAMTLHGRAAPAEPAPAGSIPVDPASADPASAESTPGQSDPAESTPAGSDPAAPDTGAAPAVHRPVHGRARAQIPVLVGLAVAALLPFAAWPLIGVLTDAVTSLGGSR